MREPPSHGGDHNHDGTDPLAVHRMRVVTDHDDVGELPGDTPPLAPARADAKRMSLPVPP